MVNTAQFLLFAAWLAVTVYSFIITYHLPKPDNLAARHSKLFYLYGKFSPIVVTAVLIGLTIYRITFL